MKIFIFASKIIPVNPNPHLVNSNNSLFFKFDNIFVPKFGLNNLTSTTKSVKIPFFGIMPWVPLAMHPPIVTEGYDGK